MDISYILSNPCAERVPLKINPSLNQKLTIYNLLEILRLPKLPSIPITPSQLTDFDVSYLKLCYKNRLRTFKSHWTLEHITPEEMTDAGFYYLGPGLRVRCLFCYVEIDEWESKNDAIFEHKRLSPLCSYFKENAGSDVCGPFKDFLQLPSLGGDTIAQKIKSFLDLVAFEQKRSFNGNKTMAHFEVRLKTFDSLLNKTMNLDIRTLCEAGFMYSGTGKSDLMTCFCCYYGLLNWQPKDDPWIEHAVWAPHCTYLLLMKGKKFVEEACIRNKCNTNSVIVKPEWQESDLINEERDVIPYRVTVCNTEHTGETDSPHESSAADPVDQPENIKPAERLYDMCGLHDNLPVLNNLPRDQNTSESHKESSAMLCKVCLKEKVEILFIPCGHAVACVQCSVTLDHCAVCRFPVDRIMRVFPYLVEENVKYPNQLECLSPKQDEEPVGPMLCKICHEDDMTIAFLPCRHICACFACAAIMEKCPVCVEPFFATLQVFL